MRKRIDRIGERYGRLTVIGDVPEVGKHRHTHKKCICDCGTECIVLTHNLVQGSTQSCGCIRKEKFRTITSKHGDSSTKLYRIYAGMLSRCSNPNNKGYRYYGGAGVDVCEEWRNDFNAFKGWAYANGYEVGMSVRRIDRKKGYSPDNCYVRPCNKSLS